MKNDKDKMEMHKDVKKKFFFLGSVMGQQIFLIFISSPFDDPLIYTHILLSKKISS